MKLIEIELDGLEHDRRYRKMNALGANWWDAVTNFLITEDDATNKLQNLKLTYGNNVKMTTMALNTTNVLNFATMNPTLSGYTFLDKKIKKPQTALDYLTPIAYYFWLPTPTDNQIKCIATGSMVDLDKWTPEMAQYCTASVGGKIDWKKWAMPVGVIALLVFAGAIIMKNPIKVKSFDKEPTPVNKNPQHKVRIKYGGKTFVLEHPFAMRRKTKRGKPSWSVGKKKAR